MFLLLLSSFLVGISTPLASYLIKGEEALSFAFHFLSMLTLIQLPFVLRKRKEITQLIFTRQFRLLVFTGLVGTLLYWCEFSALKVGLPVSHISFLSLTVPAWVLLHEYMRGRSDGSNLNKWIMAMIGSGMVILPELGRSFQVNHLLPVFTSLFLAAFLICSKRTQEAGISPLVTSFFNDLLSLMGIVLVILMKGETVAIIPAEPTNMFLYALVIGLLPGLIFLYGLKKTELLTASTIVILEPIVLGVIAVAIDSDVLGVQFVTGAVLITLANMPEGFFEVFRKVRVLYAALNLFK